MGNDLEEALRAFEEATEEVLLFVKAAAYGLRLAVQRVGGLGAGSRASAEMERLILALERGEDYLSDVVVLALGDHFRAFLARALELPHPPPLPETPEDVETLAGAPGALREVPFWFPLLLQLYRISLGGGQLDERALESLGLTDLEIVFPGGKVKLFREGDRVALSEGHLDQTAEAVLDAARTICSRLLAS